MLIGISFPDNNNHDNMFAHLSKQAKQAKQDNQANQARLMDLATIMRDSVRRHMHPLLQIDQHNHPELAAPLAEIYMREFACTLQTLKQVNWIASKYHEHAFDNTDAYIEGNQLSPHEMTTEQRHASQILLGVGNNYSEINVALKMLDCNVSMRDVMGCDASAINALAQKFQTDSCVPEDAFERLQHITRQVWSLVNMLAFSNLFRFADPAQPILISNPDDAVFIPHIPMQQTPTAEPEQKPEVVVLCNDCGKKVDTTKMHHRMGLNPTDAYLCRPCGFKREFPDEYREEFSDDESDEGEEKKMNAQYQTHFNEIVEMLADGKITDEQACTLFEELSNEYSK